jgi:MBG domain/Trehalose utilisation
MTGPCSATVQPHRTRARRLLPFLAIIAMACSEHPTSPQLPGTDAPASVRLHPYLSSKSGQAAPGTSFLRAQSSQLVSLGSATASARVLLLADTVGASTTALANSIADAGFLVTVRQAPEYTWNGTDPSLDDVDLVVHLNGYTFGEGMLLSPSSQTALLEFVRAGGGFIGSQWSGYEASIGQDSMPDLVLAGFIGPVEENCGSCAITYMADPEQLSHPVLAGIPDTFTFVADGHASGALVDFPSQPSTVLMQVTSGAPGVMVRNFGAGKVVNFSFAPNYSRGADGQTLQDPTVQQLYVNAVRWAARSSNGPTKAPATITLVDPVTTFDGTVKSVSVTTNPAGLAGVTLTYSQDGFPVSAPVNAGEYQVSATLINEDYEAPQASGTLTIGQATPVIQWAPTSILVGTALSDLQLNASATGVGGVSLAGEYVYLPAPGKILSLAGTESLSVEFLPLDVNYKNVIKTVTVLVVQPQSGLTFRGFYLPVRNMPVQNKVMAGRAVPVKFSISGNQGQNALDGAPTSAKVDCVQGAAEQLIDKTLDLRASHLEMTRGTGEYRYDWKTSASWAGTCRKLVVTLVDGSRHEAVFRFTPELPPAVGRRDDHQASAPKKPKLKEKAPKQEISRREARDRR